MEFKPTKKGSFSNVIKEHLLNGDIIRYDFRDEKPLEVLLRTPSNIKYLGSMHNIGMERDKVVEEIYCSHDVLHEVVAELSKTYSVRKVWCGYSGCCQYSTYGVYLD